MFHHHDGTHDSMIADRHGAGKGAESSITGSADSRKRQWAIRPGLSSWDLNAHPQWHTSSNKPHHLQKGQNTNSGSPCEPMGPFSLKLSQLPSRMWWKDPTDEDTTYLNHRTWKKSSWDWPGLSSLLIIFARARREYVYYWKRKVIINHYQLWNQQATIMTGPAKYALWYNSSMTI